VPFKSFNPTYRGRLKKDAPPLDLKKIRRVSIMIRSFFGAQEGDFSLSIRSIAATKKIPDPDEKARWCVIDPRQLEDGIGRDLEAETYYTVRFNNGLVKVNAPAATHHAEAVD
jgi:hypothetical protein